MDPDTLRMLTPIMYLWPYCNCLSVRSSHPGKATSLQIVQYRKQKNLMVDRTLLLICCHFQS